MDEDLNIYIVRVVFKWLFYVWTKWLTHVALFKMG